MDAFMKLSREAQGMLVGTALFIILSFFGWQAASIDLGPLGSHSVSFSLWHSFYGVIIGIIAILLLAWEIIRMLDVKIEFLAGVEPGVISTGLAVALGILTIIIFLDWSDFRAWPEYVGTLLAIAIAVLAFLRAKKEGVGMPAMPANVSINRGGGAAAASTGAAVATPTPTPAPAPPPPAAPAPAPEAPAPEAAAPEAAAPGSPTPAAPADPAPEPPAEA